MTDTDIPQTLDLFAQLEMPSEQPEALLLPPVPPSDAPTTSSPDDGLNLPLYAERCYLEYAMSVVKGRALPAVQDGQKPVQRRILYTMKRLGLEGNSKPVKSARVVGEVLGKYHPHGDTAAYDAMVRMAQDFSLRYPLIDGQGNFGSRDGDGAAAMRYTEARLTPISELLLSDLDSETVDWTANYDGSLQEPQLLPARLPFVLLNGASGIAVGMACELPPHNLREVAAACQLVLQGETDLTAVMQVLPGPDFAGGGQLINPDSLPAIYETGRGSLRLRARWQVEPLAKGQWRVVIEELPQGTSTAKIMAEIESLLNPQPKAGKKAISQEQAGLKAALANLLETNVPVNMTAINDDGNPRQTGLVSVLSQWASFRVDAFQRQCRYEHRKASERVHILEGRLLVLLHIDEVIAVIRQSDEPKTELMARFALSELQAEDILEIRLRQLARLEHIKIEQELGKLRERLAELQRLLDDEGYLRQTLVAQVQADAERFGDARRTLIQSAEVVTRSDATNVADEAVTVIVSKQGFVRTRLGKVEDVNSLPFKAGDGLLALFETRTVEWLFVLDSAGRVYAVPVAQLPGGKGDGMPITALIELPSGVKPSSFACGNLQSQFVVASSGGKGFICTGADLFSNRKAGKDCLTLADAKDKPMLVTVPACAAESAPHLLVLSLEGNGLAYPLSEVRVLAKGAGVTLIAGGIADVRCACDLNEKVVLGKYSVTADKLLGKRAAKGTPLARKRRVSSSS
ncbi:MAG: hypothetical protein B7Z48_05135 [Thiotrichales bacterium 12-47-6]|nr:MAG: hypothetical protein B7Z48_05135 [Thiotrichales bacterium 12-47-6]